MERRLSLDDAAVISTGCVKSPFIGVFTVLRQKVALQAFSNSIIGIIANISTTTHSNMINNMRDKLFKVMNLLKIL